MQDLKAIREEFESNEKTAAPKKVDEAKKNEEGIDGVIKALVDAKPSDDNAEQGKFVSLMKGLAFSDDPKATAFMKKLMGAIDGSFAGAKNEEKDNIMKACKGLCVDSTDEEIEKAAKDSGHDVAAIKKVIASKEKVSEGLSGIEVRAIMQKAHSAEILDMMSDELDGFFSTEKNAAKLSKLLAGYSEKLAKVK